MGVERREKNPTCPSLSPSPERQRGDGEAIELPEEDTELWQHMVTVPLGQPVLLNTLPDSTAPGRTVALITVVNAFTLDR